MPALWGFRIYPWCMAFPVIAANFTCYGSAIGKPVLVHVVALLEGLVLVPAFSMLLFPAIGLNVGSIRDVVTVSKRVRAFCADRGIDTRRTFLSGLCLEEMAGNVVDHGFSADKRKHSVDIRVVHKGDDLILRIKDDCIPFDPAERRNMVDPDDKTSNIGIRIVFEMSSSVNYQHMFGLNVLTIRI